MVAKESVGVNLLPRINIGKRRETVPLPALFIYQAFVGYVDAESEAFPRASEEVEMLFEGHIEANGVQRVANLRLAGSLGSWGCHIFILIQVCI